MARLHEESEEDLPDLAEVLRNHTATRQGARSHTVAVGIKQKEESCQLETYKTLKCQSGELNNDLQGKIDGYQFKRQQKALKMIDEGTFSPPRIPKSVKSAGSNGKDKCTRDERDSWCDLEARFPRSPLGSSKEAMSTNSQRVLQKMHQDNKTRLGLDQHAESKVTHHVGKSSKSVEDDGWRRPCYGAQGQELGIESSSEDGDSAILVFAPQSSKSPCKPSSRARFLTPRSSPPRWTGSVSILPSPSSQHRIPPSPYRPSMDAFWSQAAMNEWNDQCSPRKASDSRRVKKTSDYIGVDEDADSLGGFLQKGVAWGSSSKKPRPLKSKKAFNLLKHDLARDFLKEVDDTVAGGQVASMAASAGGIHIHWSNKLSSTAGRAHWRREYLKAPDQDSKTATEQLAPYRHVASIELADKVIDDQDRLMNVVAHEYCHLANFMISGVRDNPHGKEFKQWARKCSDAFRHRGVEVTTKHSYTIDYKYIWTCSKCGTTFKRHSKSIDPSRHTCGACKAKLIQIQPTPRSTGPSDYQVYVKEYFQPMKQAHPGLSHKEIMSLLAAAYKDHKTVSGQKEMLSKRSFTAPAINDEPEVHGDCDSAVDELDKVARTLHVLNLSES